MKKFALIMLAMVFIGGIVLITGCDKDDISKPVITLTGAGEITINLGETWTDPGVAATDDEDGDLTTKVTTTGTVNNQQVNTYTLKYNVTDAAGNMADEKERIVKVKSDLLAGTYAIDLTISSGPGAGTYNYTATVTQSGTNYNKLVINGFSGFTGLVVYADVLAANITVPSQSPAGLSPSGSVMGNSGTYDGAATPKKVLTLSYNIAYDGGGGTDVCTEVWTKQ